MYLKKIKLFEEYKELNDILDKISKKGKSSLTSSEKEYLNNWHEDKVKEKKYENGPFRIKLLKHEIDNNKPMNSVFHVELEYNGKKYMGTISTNSSNYGFFQWDLEDKQGNQIDIDPDHYYELDDCVQDMFEEINNQNQD